MATVTSHKKSVAINPLKLSQPLGASLAFLGLKGMMPLFHGSQGCTAFAKVTLVRHFREAIPMSTTAMTEVTTILGGEDNIEQAILTLVAKAKPEIIGLCTTGLTETRGDDMDGILKSIRGRHPELDELPIIFVSTPDFKGALQEGFAAAVESMVRSLPEAGEINHGQVSILAGSQFTPGDLQEIKDIVTDFGLVPVVVPDLSGSLDGHLGENFSATTTGGTTLAQLRSLGQSAFTLALGDSMRPAAEILQQRFGTPYEVLSQLTGLEATDNLIAQLLRLNQIGVPEKYCRQRRQLQDAMLDAHFYFGRKRVALALESDQLATMTHWLTSMGAKIQTAIVPTRSPLLEKLPIETVTVGDLGDFEDLAAGADLLITNSHGAEISRRLDIPLYRMGIPIHDRLGNGQRCTVGYRGTVQILFDIGNLLLEREEAMAKH
ncbi:nitrogenase iron-molybdenum cofactor biosynthesis protein NifN [Pseudanabaena sp. PCC 6802]|uniref:nitrogenase iron-molybdenum cofactor biosynthesis protein NifN n=1 Tax=Pseudanabaena sp. PCC 6802 TaxID=118173 RepID=UPI00034B1CC9|nr:nitrogenase iron-molybdenum cofactor biosynthesis protein NifN [Pseudanabaena sp. PCC 6802]